MIDNSITDPDIIKILAEKVRRRRLKMNLTQKKAADAAGIHYNTLSKFEQGNDITLLSFIQVLRAIGELESLNALLPDPAPSPVQLLKEQKGIRERASSVSSDSKETAPEW